MNPVKLEKPCTWEARFSGPTGVGRRGKACGEPDKAFPELIRKKFQAKSARADAQHPPAVFVRLPPIFVPYIAAVSNRASLVLLSQKATIRSQTEALSAADRSRDASPCLASVAAADDGD